MFNSKKTKLFETGSQKQTSDILVKESNPFINAALKKSAETLSGNGALKYDTTGNAFVDQFGKLGSYKQERNFKDISHDMSIIWAINPKMTIAFTFFIRMITRFTSLFDGSKTSVVQRGSGLKHEGIMRMIWLHVYHTDVFWNNIGLYISISSWRDIFEMLRYDLQYNGWEGRKLNWDKFGLLLLAGLENPNTSELIKKYLPQIKAKSKCTTIETQSNTLIGKWLSNLIFGKSSYQEYRKLKSSGTAHSWQQLISKKLMKDIDFNSVHGRALSLMVSSKFIENNNLTDVYEKWISSKPIAKYTGYVHELFEKLPKKKYQIDTLNAQFNGLVDVAKNNIGTSTGLIVVRDTSGSMGSTVTGTNMSCYNIGKALALFFSEMLPDGYFSNSWIEFNSNAKMHTWKGSTPYEKWTNDQSSFNGSTNFMSVIQLFIDLKSKGVEEKHFPSGILCISDSEFNPSSLDKTNVETALIKLMENGFSDEYVSKFKIVLWNLVSSYYGNNTGKKFETFGDVENVYYFSGYDASIISFLTGGVEKEKVEPKNAKEVFETAMEQEIMQMINI